MVKEIEEDDRWCRSCPVDSQPGDNAYTRSMDATTISKWNLLNRENLGFDLLAGIVEGALPLSNNKMANNDNNHSKDFNSIYSTDITNSSDESRRRRKKKDKQYEWRDSQSCQCVVVNVSFSPDEEETLVAQMEKASSEDPNKPEVLVLQAANSYWRGK